MTPEELPDSFHVALIAGLGFFVDDATRKEMEVFLRASTTESLTVDTILGEEITFHRDYLSLLYSSTPETRRLDAIIRKRNQAESELL